MSNSIKIHNRLELELMTVMRLREVAKALCLRPRNTPKSDLIEEVLKAQEEWEKEHAVPTPPEEKAQEEKVQEEKVREEKVQEEKIPAEKPRAKNGKKDTKQKVCESGDPIDPMANKEYFYSDGTPAVIDVREGVVEILPDGYGFIRANNFEAGQGDGYINALRIKKWGLRKGDWVKAECRKEHDTKPAPVIKLLEINGMPPETAFSRPHFDSLTPIHPDRRFKLETEGTKNEFAIRAIDLVAPIGKGQRAMIVSPPKAGKTTLLKKIASSIAKNYPTAYLMVLLVDERPEEVTDMKRSINGEVVYSTFDEMPEHHTKASELVLERAKRIVELGGDVVILMDSLTRLARAYNLTIAPSGRTLSGGLDPSALHNPKRFFGAARNIENGGSLTIIATALVDTGSRMDDVIYEEFKGTGNMEIHLDRKLSEKRIFPAIDLARSGTRREELLMSQQELEGVWLMRKMLSVGDTQEATENLMTMMTKTSTNAEFIEQIRLQVSKLQKEGFTLVRPKN